MRKNTLLVGVLSLLGTSQAMADDWVIELMKSNASHIELVKDASFDVGYGCIGNTSTETVIGLGEVDFGTDGTNYKATGVEFAHGWGSYDEEKIVVLSAGATAEEAVPFNEMTVTRTYGYHQFELFAENMDKGDGFILPTGKQKVWLTFRAGQGNLRSVKFYENALSEGMEGVQPWPNQAEGYGNITNSIEAAAFERAVEVPENPEEDPYKDAKYDENTACWGGTNDGFIVKSTEEIDFGNGEFQQLVAYIGHDGERYTEYMEFYIDEVKPENMVARTWTGINIQEWNKFTPVATTLKEVTGSHHLYVKWGNATNLHQIDLVKEPVWHENPDCGVVYDNAQPSENAVVFVTKGESGATEGGDVSQGETAWKIIQPISGDAKCEGGNIGYTKAGVVVMYQDIDFKNGYYKDVFINASCDKTYIGSTTEEANYSLYVDLDDIDWATVTNLDELHGALEGREPVAVVRAQGTGAWSNKLTTTAPLSHVEGIHNLYVVYNLPDRDNIGTNIYGLYLDPGQNPEEPQPATGDLFIPLMKSNAENIELVKDATFDVGYGNIGHTSENTIIGLGEVDFGKDGNAYQATGVEFANGWGAYGEAKYVVLSAGATPEEAVPFNEIRVERTFGYHQFDMFAENMKEEDGFARPIGKQKVWLTFRAGSGNLRSVKFYEEAIPEEEEGLQAWPNEMEGYEEMATVIDGSALVRAVDVPESPEEDPYKDAKYNEETGCWGSTNDGFIVKSNEEIDFGNGEFQQLVAYIGHDGERYTEYMEFYIDEVKPENMVARTWTGINIQEWNSFTPVATRLKEVTGSHRLFIKWGGATNLQKIELVKDSLWFENPDCGVVYENVEPSKNAVVFVTTGENGATEGTDTNQGIQWEVIKPISGDARCEGSNIGYTKAGVVVAYKGIDFKDNYYKEVFINASCEPSYIGSTIEDANFTLYTDLNDIDWENVTNLEELNAALEGREPVAVVRAQGTGSWGNKLTTAGDLADISGIHDLYVVYNLPDRDNIGANIYGLYLDPGENPQSIKENIAQGNGIEVRGHDNRATICTGTDMHVTVYTVNGTAIAEMDIKAGTTLIDNLNPGIYILKATDKNGKATTQKFIVK